MKRAYFAPGGGAPGPRGPPPSPSCSPRKPAEGPSAEGRGGKGGVDINGIGVYIGVGTFQVQVKAPKYQTKPLLKRTIQCSTY